jgi:hypothetical protein
VDEWFLWGHLRDIDHLDDIGVERRLMSEWNSKKREWGLD